MMAQIGYDIMTCKFETIDETKYYKKVSDFSNNPNHKGNFINY